MPPAPALQSLPLARHARVKAITARDMFPMIRGRSALLSSPGPNARVQLQPGFRSLALNIPEATLAEAAHTLTGAAPRAVRFDRTLALDVPRTAPFCRLLRERVASER